MKNTPDKSKCEDTNQPISLFNNKLGLNFGWDLGGEGISRLNQGGNIYYYTVKYQTFTQYFIRKLTATTTSWRINIFVKLSQIKIKIIYFKGCVAELTFVHLQYSVNEGWSKWHFFFLEGEDLIFRKLSAQSFNLKLSFTVILSVQALTWWTQIRLIYFEISTRFVMLIYVLDTKNQLIIESWE